MLQEANHLGLSVTIYDDLRQFLHTGQFGMAIFPTANTSATMLMPL